MVNVINITDRKCVKCKIFKPTTSEYFYADKNRPHGLMYRCKECDKLRKDRRTKRYENFTQEQKDRHYMLGVKYRATPKGKAIGLVNAYIKEDRRKGLKCDLTQYDVMNVYLMSCTYCGYPSTGFDRKDNKIGHTIENCVPCCKECNVARMDNFTHEETFILGKAIKVIKDKRKKQFIEGTKYVKI